MTKSTAVRKKPDLDNEMNRERGQDTIQKYENTLSDELVFAFCSPIGSIKKPIIDSFEREIKKYGYSTQNVKLSSLFDIDPQNIELENLENPEAMWR